MLQLNEIENESLRSQFVTSKSRGGTRYLPYVFTELGIAMLSNILSSDKAILINIEIMRAFVDLRQLYKYYRNLNLRIDNLEDSVNNIYDILDELTTQKALSEKPSNPIGYKFR